MDGTGIESARDTRRSKPERRVGQVLEGGTVRQPAQAESDDAMVRLWLHGRSPGTMRAYAADAGLFSSVQASRCGR